MVELLNIKLGKAYGVGDIVKITRCTEQGNMTLGNDVVGRIVDIHNNVLIMDCSTPFHSHTIRILLSSICDIEEYNGALQKVAEPLVQYLQEHYHPHCTAIVDQIHAEILEGVEVASYNSPD